MMDIGAVEQRANSGNQHDIVGSNQFPQFTLSLSRDCEGWSFGSDRVRTQTPVLLFDAFS
jgi:hypothetical protein